MINDKPFKWVRSFKYLRIAIKFKTTLDDKIRIFKVKRDYGKLTIVRGKNPMTFFKKNRIYNYCIVSRHFYEIDSWTH